MGLTARQQSNTWLFAALGLYLTLAATTIQSVGTVGEVALGWMQGPPVAVRIELDQPPPDHSWGPFHARQTRPIERLVLGPLHVPLAINTYTGAIPDWPARLVHATTHSARLVHWLHIVLGAGLLAALFQFLRRHAGVAAAVASTFVLATRWDFLFYRSVLGGTEVVLVGATLAMIWALWARRWRGSPHGLVAIALAVGIGLHAKLTFVVVATSLALTAALLRRDRPPMGPPRRSSRLRTAFALSIPLLPLVLANVHQTFLPGPRIHSHDHPELQLERVFNALRGHDAPTRESLQNITAWLGDPLGFLARAYSVEAPPDTTWLLVTLGWGITLVGVAAVWRARHPTPREALLRLCSLFLPIGIGGLLLVARDLHHLATLSIVVAMVVGLAADQLAGRWAPPRSIRRTLAALVLVSPWMAAGTVQLAATDAVVQQIETPTFRTDGQAALGAMIRNADPRRVWVADYESMGALELVLADTPVEVVHAWGAASRRARGEFSSADFGAVLLQAAAGDHLLTVQASAPMVYNLRGRGRTIDDWSRSAGVQLIEVDRLPSDQAVLYRVERVATR